MSTYTSEPGTRLAGRYRLVDQVAAGSGWTMWKAQDETLARPVSVLTFAPGFPRIAQVVTAARAASRLTDPRLAQVFDVEDGGDQAYVVLEWVGGETLTDLLCDGPLEPARACALIADAARALAGAHAAGQVHLRLTPDTLRWTRSSGVKITGLGIDAALAGDGLVGAAAGEPTRTDTIDLAALLYASLTGYWPGESQTALPPAPESDGAICTPRQVTADVPAAIDGVVCRALLQRGGRQGPPITSPGEFADVLAGVAPPVPYPDPVPMVPIGHLEMPPGYGGHDGFQPNPGDPATWALPGRGSGGTAPYRQPHGRPYPAARPPREPRGGASRVAVTVVVVLVIAALVATALVISNSLRKSSANQASGSRPSTSASAAPTGAAVLAPVSDSTFNIYGSPAGNTENPSSAAEAIDGNLSTAWQTSYYIGRSDFGGLKPGTGLLLDMGKTVKLSEVEVLFGKQCCTTAEIYLGNSNEMTKTSLSNFTKVAPAAKVHGNNAFTTNSSATGRYVLIWITGLPPMQGSSGRYQAAIYNVVVRGTAAG
jgi:serine/threonine protein kinase